jgi:catechol 2,3-dioxygenase-like lactoylglutathione lyase family enzyme
MIDHIAVQVSDVDSSAAFYTDVFGPLGLVTVLRVGLAVGLGRDQKPFLWLGPGGRTETRELHLALVAGSRDEVDAVHAAAVARGVEVLHQPRLWPEYHARYYGVFLRDPDGHNVEAVCHAG